MQEDDQDDYGDDDEESGYSDEMCDEVDANIVTATGELEGAQKDLAEKKKEVMERINKELKENTGYDYTDYDKAVEEEGRSQREYNEANEALGSPDDVDLREMEDAYERYDSAYDDFWESTGEVGRLTEENEKIDAALNNEDGTAIDPADWVEPSEDRPEITDEAQGDTEYDRWADQARLNDAAIAAETAEGLAARDRAEVAEGELNDLVGSEDGVERFEDYKAAEGAYDEDKNVREEIYAAIEGYNGQPNPDGPQTSPSAEKERLDRGTHPDIQDEQRAVNDWTKEKRDLEKEYDSKCEESEGGEDDNYEDEEDEEYDEEY